MGYDHNRSRYGTCNLWMSHVTRATEPRHTYEGPCRTYEWVMSHMWVSHVAHMSESCRTYEWVMSHMRGHHVARITCTTDYMSLTTCASNCSLCCLGAWSVIYIQSTCALWRECHSLHVRLVFRENLHTYSVTYARLDLWRECHSLHVRLFFRENLHTYSVTYARLDSCVVSHI